MGRLITAYCYSVLSLVSLCLLSCTEPFTLVTESFEDILVIEATITDELKYQEIKVSRTYLLENNSPIFEENALVKIEDSNQNIFNFTYSGEGVYLSTQPFQAIDGVSYKLLIIAADGKQYTSSEEFLAPKANIEDLYVEMVDFNGELGIQVLLDSNADLGSANFFRYEYEETYKIEAPNYNYFDAFASNVTGSGETIEYSIDFTPRGEKRICYSTNNSTEILLTNVNSLRESRVSKFPIRFISINNPVIRSRYSILVRQYVQSADANNFYKILRELGSDESLLIDNQPGFIKGNIFSQQSSQEKVIGFFDVSSVTSKRIYFDYSDFNIELPPYFYECEFLEWDYEIIGPFINERLLLYQLIEYSDYKYSSKNGSVYLMVTPECGDCTTFSSNIKPIFWED